MKRDSNSNYCRKRKRTKKKKKQKILGSYFKTKICKLFYQGNCKNGDKCNFAHSKKELSKKVNLRKTKLCPYFLKNKCFKEKDCKYAHGIKELRSTNEFYKTEICFNFQRGYCEVGDKCRYAHGEKDRKTDINIKKLTKKQKKQKQKTQIKNYEKILDFMKIDEKVELKIQDKEENPKKQTKTQTSLQKSDVKNPSISITITDTSFNKQGSEDYDETNSFTELTELNQSEDLNQANQLFRKVYFNQKRRKSDITNIQTNVNLKNKKHLRFTKKINTNQSSEKSINNQMQKQKLFTISNNDLIQNAAEIQENSITKTYSQQDQLKDTNNDLLSSIDQSNYDLKDFLKSFNNKVLVTKDDLDMIIDDEIVKKVPDLNSQIKFSLVKKIFFQNRNDNICHQNNDQRKKTTQRNVKKNPFDENYFQNFQQPKKSSLNCSIYEKNSNTPSNFQPKQQNLCNLANF